MSVRFCGAFLGAFLMFVSACVTIASAGEGARKGNPADQPALDLTASVVQDEVMKIDGDVIEWDGGGEVEFKTLLSGEYEYDWTGPKDLSGRVAAMYGAEKIYFRITVKDNAVVAKKKQWKSDRVELWLASESPEGRILAAPRGLLLDVGPAVGGGAASVKWMSGKQGGAEAVAFIGGGGYDFEIGVRYDALSKESPVMGGAMRYCVLVRDWDQDDPNEDEASIGTCPINPAKSSGIKPAQMGRIKLDLGSEIWEAMQRDRAVNLRDEWVRMEADVGGSPLREIVAASNRKLVVAGYGLGTRGLSYMSMDVQKTPSEGKPRLEVRDVNRDGKPEIILTRIEGCRNSDAIAERVYIFQFIGAVNNGALSMSASYVTQITDLYDNSSFVRNSYSFSGRNAMVQTFGQSAGSGGRIQTCELEGGYVPFLFEGGPKRQNVNLNL